jgi:FKBP-type peptidyl-prolyl cis-trans isomerase SlpA
LSENTKHNKKTIAKNSLVAMHYTVRLMDGSVADSTLDEDKPAVFEMGAGDISEAFEAALIGMAVGEEKRVDLKAIDAYGEHDLRNVKLLPQERFPKAHLEPGTIMEFDSKAGDSMAGIIRSVDNGLVTVDFNHMLAGQDLTFDVKIVEIDPH